MSGAFGPGRVRGSGPILFLSALLAAAPAAAGQLQLVTQADPPLPAAHGQATRGAASADGRYVVFLSDSNHQIAGQSDLNGEGDIFLFDRMTGATTLVSHSIVAPNRAGNYGTFWPPSISGDGRWIAFASSATDLVAGQIDPGPSSGTMDIFLYDRVTGTTTLVSRASGSTATTANDSSSTPAISADGNYIAFASTATNLIPGQIDAGSDADLFLYERASGTVTLVSHAAGAPATAGNGVYDIDSTPALSPDGRFVVYHSTATDLVAGQIDTNGAFDCFLFDRTTGENVLVSHASSSAITAGFGTTSTPGFGSPGTPPGLSNDGRWIVFASTAPDLVAGQVDESGTNDVFLFDRDSGTTTLVSRTRDTAVTSAGATGRGVISGDGRFVVFASPGTNLVAGQTEGNTEDDVFLYDRVTDSLSLVSRAAGSAVTASRGSLVPEISADGSIVTFISAANNLIAGQVDPILSLDCFLYERATGAVMLVSHAPGSATTAAAVFTRFCHATAGGHVVVESQAALVASPADPEGTSDVFLFDRATGINAAVSLVPTPLSGTPDDESRLTALSADGRWLAYFSPASNQIAGLTESNFTNDLFLYDRVTGQRKLVSHRFDSATTTGNGSSDLADLSADGRYLAFQSGASDLMPDFPPQPLLSSQVFLYDRWTDTTRLVSHSPSSPGLPANGYSDAPGISADGRFVVWTFAGTLDALIPGVSGFGGNVVLQDEITGTTTLVSHAAGSATTGANGSSFSGRLSADGNWVAFRSAATDLVSGQVDMNQEVSPLDLFLYNRLAGTTTLVSRSAASPTTAANSGVLGRFSLSQDGRFVAYESSATDVVPGQVDTPDSLDVFLFDRATGTNTLVSHTSGSATATGDHPSVEPRLSADGRYLIFTSYATDLVPGVDANNDSDVFLYDRVTGTTVRVSDAAGSPGTAANASSFDGVLNADGSRIAFSSHATDLVPGQVDLPYHGPGTGTSDLFLQDRDTGSRTLVSGVAGSATITANGRNTSGSLFSADGRALAFMTDAPDLVAAQRGDLNDKTDVFLYTTTPPSSYFTLTPCRLIDTRRPQDGPALVSGITETWTLQGFCGIPSTARSVAVNITVTQPTAAGHLTLWSGDGPAPVASTMNFGAGQTRANNAILPLSATGNGTLAIQPLVQGGGTVHVLVDVVGWFE